MLPSGLLLVPNRGAQVPPAAALATLSVMGGKAHVTGDATSAAVEELWYEFHGALLAFFRKRVRDASSAEDLLMECFLRIQQGIGGLEDATSIRGWIYRIAHNLVIDHYRKQRPDEELDDMAAPDPEPVNEEAIAFGSCVMSMISRLPVRYRDAMRLVELEGSSQKQVAETLGLSLSGAKSRVQRGRLRLQEMVARCCKVQLDRRGNILAHDCAGPCC